MADPANFEERLGIARDAFAALIAADAWLSVAPAVPVITEEKGDVAATIDQALKRLGLCIVALAADGDQLVRKGRTLVMRVRFVAQISEKVLLNKAACQAAGIPYRPASRATLRVMKAVDRQPNGLDPAGAPHRAGINEFELVTDGAFELLRTPTDVVYEVNAYSLIEI